MYLVFGLFILFEGKDCSRYTLNPHMKLRNKLFSFMAMEISTAGHSALVRHGLELSELEGFRVLGLRVWVGP